MSNLMLGPVRLAACLFAAAVMQPSLASAQGYKPRTCSAAAPYAGPALLTPATEGAFEAGPLSLQSMRPDVAARLDAALDKAFAATGAKSITAAVNTPGVGRWSGERGVAASGQVGGAAPLHFWASAGKAFTAVAILQLVEEGRISLDQPVATWVKGLPNGDVVTVDHLLSHTSGLFSANEDPAFRKAPRRLSTPDLVKIVRKHGAMFCPGENWRYTNSGYQLLGDILEQVEGRPYDEVIAARVLSKLAAGRIRMVTADDALMDVAVPSPSPVLANGEPAIDPRIPGAAGGVVADADGMIGFLSALLGGELLSPGMTQAMVERLYPMFGQPPGYGRGLMVYELPAEPGRGADVWLGHSGGAPGVKAIVAYSLAEKTFVAVALTGDGPAEAAANLLLKQLSPPQDAGEN
ncbi:serine hydrolase [bacterium]|nr:serine hydrolase [bacterium]